MTTDNKIEFAKPKTIQQADMLEALEALTPEQRTELVADWYQFWVTAHDLRRVVE